MTDIEIINELDLLIERFSTIVEELKKKDGIISTDILNRVDTMNALTVEI